MSSWWSSPERGWVRKRPRQALLCGLDNAGKSSLLCALPQVRERFKRFAQRRAPGADRHARTLYTVPTTDLQLVELTMWRQSERAMALPSAVHWRLWDVSGQGRHRALWDKFCRHDLDAVVFVVDASDLDRAATARDELRRLFAKNAALRGRQLPLLVLANKTDKDGELLSLSDLTRALQLEELQTTHSVALETFEVSALKGTDVERAFQWLTDQV